MVSVCSFVHWNLGRREENVLSLPSLVNTKQTSSNHHPRTLIRVFLLAEVVDEDHIFHEGLQPLLVFIIGVIVFVVL